MEYEERRPWLPVLAGVLAIILVALLVVAGLQPWDDRVEVRFVSYGGGSIAPLQVQPGTCLDQSSLPRADKSNRRFVGWCLDEAATRLYSGEPVREDMALYAAYAAADDFAYNGLSQVFLGDVSREFALTVASEETLTGDNLDRFVLLSTCYGGNAELSVEAAEDGLYRLTANWGESSSYQLQLLSPQVRFADPELEKRGVSPDARMITFTVPGSNYANISLLEDIRYVPSEVLLSYCENAICVKGRNPYRSGQVLRLPRKDMDGYYAVMDALSPGYAQTLGLTLPNHNDYTCYRLRPATSGELLAQMEVRLRKQVLQEQLPDIQQLQDQIREALEGDLTVNAVTDLMIAGVQETQAYKAFSQERLGSVEQALPAARNTKTGVRVGIATNQPDPRYFSDMALYTPNDTIFHSITLQLQKEVTVENAQGQEMIVEAAINLTVGLHVHVDVAVSGTETVAFDASVTTLTHTQAESSVHVRSADGKHSLRFSGTFDSILDEAAQGEETDFFRLYRQVLGSGSVTLLDLQVAEAEFAAGPLNMTLPVRLRLDAQLLGALKGELDLKTGSVAGIRGDSEKGCYSYQYNAEPSLKLKQMAQGHSGIQVVAAFDAQMDFTGLETLGSLRLQSQSGCWSDVYGYHYLNYYHMGAAGTQEASGGYYARLGLLGQAESQTTVLPKQFEDAPFHRQVMAQLGSRLAVTGLVAGEPVAMGDGGLELDDVRLSQRVFDLVTGRTITLPADMDALEVGTSGPFRVEDRRVLYTGKDQTAEGFLHLTCKNSSGGFRHGVTVCIPLSYAADGAAPPAEKAQACIYTFHVLDEMGHEQVATVTAQAGVAPDVAHLITAPEGLRFAGWYDGAVEVLTQVRPGVTEYYARYEKE